jgi:hypothetical protein
MIKKASYSMTTFTILGLAILAVMIVTYWCIATALF